MICEAQDLLTVHCGGGGGGMGKRKCELIVKREGGLEEHVGVGVRNEMK